MKQRIFIAFKVSEEAKGELCKIQKELKQKNKKTHLTWTKSRGFHVTLQFLGEIEEYKIEEVKNALLEIANSHRRFEYWLDRVDAFPNPAHPKIIMVCCEEEYKAGGAIYDDLAKKLKKLDLVRDSKPWKPHITLSRNREEAGICGLNTIKVKKITWNIETIELIKSDLEPGGARYTILKSFELKNP